jgi:hypothetical protein
MRNPFRSKAVAFDPEPWRPGELFTEYRAVVSSFDDDKQFPIVSVLAANAEQAQQAITHAVNAKALEMGVSMDYLQVQMLASPEVVRVWNQDINTRSWGVFATPANHAAIEAPKRKAS